MAALAGAAMAAIHAFLVVTLRANQIVSGLALTIFAGAAGLSSYLGNDLKLDGLSGEASVPGGLPEVVAGLARDRADRLRAVDPGVRVVGLRRPRRALPHADTNRSQRCARSASLLPRPTRWGSTSPRYRYAHTLVGGAFAGVGGAAFSLSITPQWADGLTRGAGWIAIALVIFAFWRPTLCLVGAYFFGAFTALPFALQGHGVTVAPELFQTLPYVATIVALVLVSSQGSALAVRRAGGAGLTVRSRRALAAVRPRGT